MIYINKNVTWIQIIRPFVWWNFVHYFRYHLCSLPSKSSKSFCFLYYLPRQLRWLAFVCIIIIRLENNIIQQRLVCYFSVYTTYFLFSFLKLVKLWLMFLSIFICYVQFFWAPICSYSGGFHDLLQKSCYSFPFIVHLLL